ncbi:type IX secretion system protein PorG [Marinilabilia rubra]|uniref:DUF6089 domain-containing protein n=1 Tax=Marinilabilia rubra TaxID=2162893 RepID=A0A2U2B9W0_9BACT|nr:DUF6089 family protein [Marinilabilia rubra]PWD99837.1 hypothetical protein DDZ16_08045 [Marinilabilia rubra]
MRIIFRQWQLLFIFFLGVTHSAISQERIEGGFFLGASYYNGDLNPGRQFYRAKPAFGGMVRAVMNSRIAFKGTITAVEIQGSYPQKQTYYPSTNNTPASYSFQRTMADISTQLEINFFQYDDPHKKEETRFTPYLSGGLAYTFYRRYEEDQSGGSENPHFILSLPFGVGVKWKPADWVHVGFEWTFRRTFVDDLDKMGPGVIDPSDPYDFQESSDWHNNDWYSFAGVFVTFDLFHQRVSCNAGF